MSNVCYFGPYPRLVALRRASRYVTLAAALAAAPAQASVLGFVEYEGERDKNTAPGYFTFQVAESPDGKFVYSVAFGANSSYTSVLNVYLRDQDTGALDLVQSLANPEGVDYGLRSARGLEISPDGNFIYVHGYNNAPFVQTISWFARDAVTGMLSYSGQVKADEVPVANESFDDEIRISNDGFYLYVSGGSDSIIVFRRAENGALSYVESVANGRDLASTRKFSVSPDGKSLYAVATTAKTLVGFTRDPVTGKLSYQQTFFEITTGAADGVAGLSRPEDVIVSEDGRFVYSTGTVENSTATSGDDQSAVVTFARDPADGRLTYLGVTVNTAEYKGNQDWDTLWWPTSLAFSRDTAQKFLYVGTQIADSINVFRRNAETGELSWVGWETEEQNGVTNLSSVQDMIVSRDGRHVYTALDQGNGISVFDTRADMSIVKKDSTDPVAIGGTVTYTLSTTNNGPSDAQNVVVSDTLPAGMSFVKATPNAPGASCSHDAGTVTCKLGSLATTAKVSTVVEVTAPGTAATVTNTATVSADQLDTTMTNNTDSEDTCVDDPQSPVCAAAGGGAGDPATGGGSPDTGGGSPGGAGDGAPAAVVDTDGTSGGGGGGGSLGWLTLLGMAAVGLRRRGRSLR